MTTLAIVERSHRGTIEQQYAHVLWLVHSLHAQAPMVLLLRGSAVSYAVDGVRAGPLRLGDQPWGTFPDYQEAIDRLHADGAAVLVCTASLDRFGLGDRPLIAGIKPVNAMEIASVAAGCAAIWYL